MERPRVHVSVAIEGPRGLLMVREGKPDVLGKWNLPGGHVVRGEPLTAAAKREVREETGYEVELTELVGVFVSRLAVRFVFRGDIAGGQPRPGHDIVGVEWVTNERASQLTPEELDYPTVVSKVLESLRAGAAYPLELLIENID